MLMSLNASGHFVNAILKDRYSQRTLIAHTQLKPLMVAHSLCMSRVLTARLTTHDLVLVAHGNRSLACRHS
jgi:hypothetical protein